MSQHATEVAAGERFEFGKNWAWFLQTLNDEKIARGGGLAQEHAGDGEPGRQELSRHRLGQRLVQPGGAAAGARVHSFDYDPNSVGCTAELKRRYYPDDDHVDG